MKIMEPEVKAQDQLGWGEKTSAGILVSLLPFTDEQSSVDPEIKD